MKLAVLVLAVAAACQARDVDDYPIGNNGGGPVGNQRGSGSGSGSGSDAGIRDGGDGDAGIAISGRVCLLEDLRKIGGALTECRPGAGGLRVTLGGDLARAATTAIDGSFTINTLANADPVWRVDSGVSEGIITSVMPVGVGLETTIPAVTTVVYNELLDTNTSIALLDSQGSVFVRVLRGTTAVAGLTASVTVPTGASVDLDPHYDGGNAQTWGTSQTGTAGIVWIPVVPLLNANPVTATITLAGTPPVVLTPTVENQSITFVTRTIP